MDNDEPPATIKMPAPLDPRQKQIAGLEKLIAQMRSRGLPDDIHVTFAHDDKGELVVEITGPMTTRQIESVARDLTVKLHDPDKPSSPKNVLIDDKSAVDWLDSERKRRNKEGKSKTPSCQGQRSLNHYSGKDLQQVIVVPTTTTAFHDQAIAAGMLLQQ